MFNKKVKLNFAQISLLLVTMHQHWTLLNDLQSIRPTVNSSQ